MSNPLFRLDRQRRNPNGATRSTDYFEGEDALLRLKAAILAAEVDLWSERKRTDLGLRTYGVRGAAGARALAVGLGLRRRFLAKSGAEPDHSDSPVVFYDVAVRRGGEWVRVDVRFLEPDIIVTLPGNDDEEAFS